MAGSGIQAQEALAEAVDKYSGKRICVVEGSIPTRDKGVYMKLAGRPAMEVLADVGGKAAAIVGSCAAWERSSRVDPQRPCRFPKPYAHQYAPTLDFVSAIESIKPTTIMGVSTIGGAFTQKVVAMSRINERPVILDL
jgi:Ni,Fe-hydrogenase I small subunit